MLDFGQCRRDSQKGIVVEIDSSIRKFDEAEDGTQKNSVKYRFVIDNAIGDVTFTREVFPEELHETSRNLPHGIKCGRPYPAQPLAADEGL
jgi:hypothetical protein